MKRKVLVGLFMFMLSAALFKSIFAADSIAKDKIIVGQAVSLSGPIAIIHDSGPAQTQKLWIDEVNAKGGIFVKEYGKKLPLELKIYDDKSDHGTLVRLLEKLILQDKVDILLPPVLLHSSLLRPPSPISTATY